MHAHARRLLLPRWPTARTHAVGQAEVARVKVLLERDERKRQRESSATPARAGIGRHATSAHRAAPPASTAQIARFSRWCLSRVLAIARGRETVTKLLPSDSGAAWTGRRSRTSWRAWRGR